MNLFISPAALELLDKGEAQINAGHQMTRNRAQEAAIATRP
jgi:hypothetical protein